MAARDNSYVRKDGTRSQRFVNLDMEEYRDLEITAQVFKKTLDEEEFKNHSAGIVLQAYLPDSFAMQQDLTEWAKNRVARGDLKGELADQRKKLTGCKNKEELIIERLFSEFADNAMIAETEVVKAERGMDDEVYKLFLKCTREAVQVLG